MRISTSVAELAVRATSVAELSVRATSMTQRRSVLLTGVATHSSACAPICRLVGDSSIGNGARVVARIALNSRRVRSSLLIYCWKAMDLHSWMCLRFSCFLFSTFDFDLSWVIGSTSYAGVRYYRVSRFDWQGLFSNPTTSRGAVPDHVTSTYRRREGPVGGWGRRHFQPGKPGFQDRACGFSNSRERHLSSGEVRFS